jgi:hypothetical protein
LPTNCFSQKAESASYVRQLFFKLKIKPRIFKEPYLPTAMSLVQGQAILRF